MENTLVDEVRRAIPTTSSEQEFERLYAQLTAAWDKGEVDRDMAESLTRLVWVKSRQLYWYEIANEQQTSTTANTSTNAPNVDVKRIYFSDMLAIPAAEGRGRSA